MSAGSVSDLHTLKEAVCTANLTLVRHGLVLGTWGNASAIDRAHSVLVIKPSGVSYDDMKPEHMVVTDLEGNAVEGSLRPSSDTPTHAALYRAFSDIGAIVHTHSHYATCWAQACKPIPCLGTTHADYFFGDVPVTKPLREGEVQTDYERNTGLAIVQRFESLDPLECPAVLVANHAPFTWGRTIDQAVENALVLEEVARMALHTIALSEGQPPISNVLLQKHFHRKHGPSAYYGQGKRD